MSEKKREGAYYGAVRRVGRISLAMDIHRRYAIPIGLNTALVIIVSAALAAALAWLSAAKQIATIAAATLLFTLAFQTNFALFHEAAHQKLHKESRWNALLGFICGLWFGMSFSMFSRSHTTHHLKNRTDEEMFDLYYAGESRLKKALFWYGMLLGLWYWTIPVANLLLVVAPGTYRRLAERLKISAEFAQQPRAVLHRVRLELLAVISVPAVLLLVGVPPLRLLVAYAAASLVWSTTQYLEHAYAPRSVIDGAFNLRATPVYSWLNLHRELDLNHHRYPHESWFHLPRFSLPQESRRSYVKHYLSQWLGPRLTTTPGPTPIASDDLVPRIGQIGSTVAGATGLIARSADEARR